MLYLDTPGIAGIGALFFGPSWTNTGQTRSDMLSLFSDTRFRIQDAERFRRSRVVGKLPQDFGNFGGIKLS